MKLAAFRHAVPLLMPTSYLLALQTTSAVALAIPAFGLFALTPVLDVLLPRDRSAGGDGRRLQTIVPGAFVVLHALCLLLTAVRAASGTLDWALAAAATASLGAIGGVSITASHELLHGPSRPGRCVGRFGMLLVAYGHFEISHLYGHHRHAGTAIDNSTAWRGESLFRYLRRTIPACYRFARAEAKRREWGWSLRRPLSPGRASIVSAVLATGLAILGGPTMLVLHLAHAAVAIFLLEATSYVQHYGLRRDEANGDPDRIAAWHSWDSDHAASNALLFRLPRHADHHLHAGHGFAELSLVPGAAPLPGGYPAMILLATVPPLWRATMDRALAGLPARATQCRRTVTAS